MQSRRMQKTGAEASIKEDSLMERHLLLVDDEPYVLAALQRCLRGEGYTIYPANNGPEALSVLEQYPIAVIVSDQRMPLMTGAEFLEQVKKRWPHTLRLMLSGYSEVQSLVETINQGAAWKFLFKPWDDDALRERLREAFELVETQTVTRKLIDQLHTANQELVRLNDIVVTGYESQASRLLAQLTLLEQVLNRQPQPYILMQDRQVVHANTAAIQLFPLFFEGMDVAALFPDGVPGPDWIKLIPEGDSNCFALLREGLQRDP